MWVITTPGFYSAVEHRDDPGKIMIRARVKGDLTALKEQVPGLKPYRVKKSDYPWRAVVSREEWYTAMAILADSVDYENFKDAVKERQGKRRADVYMSVWSVLHGLTRRRPVKPWSLSREQDGEEGCLHCGVFLLSPERLSNDGSGVCNLCPAGAHR
jgi:hypothetical protein